jgi:hypothetical protein
MGAEVGAMSALKRWGLPPGAMVGMSRWLPSGDALTRWMAFLLMVGAVLLLWFATTTRTPDETTPTRLSLVLQDGWRQDDVHVQAWRDAADELGFVLDVVTASQLMRQGATQRDAALILPDTIHRQMNEPLLAHLRSRVQDGARLMWVHDAGLLDMQGQLHTQQSRASGLVGVRYALRAKLGTGMQRAQQAWVPSTAIDQLNLPPGLLLREGSKLPLTTPQTTPQVTERLALAAGAGLVAAAQPGAALLPILPFVTEGRVDGQLLMGGDADVVLASSHAVGRGTVLFVNLPLGAMKLQSEGLLLHSFLRHFAQDIAQLAQFSPLPDARGALVLNWQIDAPSALPAMAQMAKMGVLELGPQSVHFGPDAGLASDEAMRDWLRRLSQREDEIGSHDLSLQTGTSEQNLKAVRSSSGKPVHEHSAHADAGQPAWLLPWLAQQGVNAYRSSGDVGQAPTRSYVQGRRGPADVWAFPALGFGGATTLEQARAGEAAENDVGAWLDDVMAYCAEQRVLRAIDFHPPAAMKFAQAFERWFEHIGALAKADRLRLTTLASHAAFANRRQSVRWQVRMEQGRLRLQANHATSLAHMSWLLPAQGFEAPQMQEGSAQVERVGQFWRVTADGIQQLVVTSTPLKSDTR